MDARLGSGRRHLDVWRGHVCTRVDFEHRPIPAEIAGGDGGGQVVEGVWTHDMLTPEIAGYARLVVDAKVDRIPSALLRTRREAQLLRRREKRERSAATDKRSAEFYAKYAWDFDVFPPGVPFD